MGTIICKNCDTTITHVEMEKVATFYSICSNCGNKKESKKESK
jgi:hypothetical protein